MIATKEGGLQLNGAWEARKIAELAGVINGNMGQDQKLLVMYSHGLRFSPIPLFGADHFKEPDNQAQYAAARKGQNNEEADFAIGSVLQWSLIERHYKKTTGRALSLPSNGHAPLFAAYYEIDPTDPSGASDTLWQPLDKWEEQPMPKLRLELGQLVVTPTITEQAKRQAERIAEHGTPESQPLILTQALAKNFLERMTYVEEVAALPMPEIEVIDTRTPLAA